MNIITLEIILIGLFLIGGVIFLVAAFHTNRVSDSTARLNEFVLAQNRRTTSSVEKAVPVQQVFSEVFFERTFGAMMKKVIQFLGKMTPQQSIERTDQKLAIIHNPGNIRAREFFAIRIILMIGGLILAILLNIRNFSTLASQISAIGSEGTSGILSNARTPSMLMGLAGVLILLVAFLMPIAWLNSRVNKVKTMIEREFPDALDLLSVCADAGLGFDQAMQRVGEYMQNTIGSEFRRVTSEMEVGVSRSDALRNMSERLNVPELSSFVTIIIQSDTLGMRIADVLHSQAEQYRIIRQYKAKEIAYRLPAKMIIPMALLILPALLIIILGPLIPRILSLLAQ